MKFALTGVGTGSTAHPEVLVQVAQKAEELGYESVLTRHCTFKADSTAAHLSVFIPNRSSNRTPYAVWGRKSSGPQTRCRTG
jgi:hypothetical protein